MKILAIDSSGLVASAAIATEDAILADYTTNFKKTHSETLLPMIDEVVKMTQTKLSELAAVAITAGPGSFTGLRIGSATAKGLCQALNLPLISVPTTLALAYNFEGSDSLLCPIMDARRSQVYSGLYQFNRESNRMETLIGQCAVPVTEMISRVNEIGQQAIFLGDGVPVFAERLKESVRVPFSLAPIHLCMQKASSVAECVFSMLNRENGQFVSSQVTEEANEVFVTSAAAFSPIYLRKSQAERERDEKIKAEE